MWENKLLIYSIIIERKEKDLEKIIGPPNTGDRVASASDCRWINLVAAAKRHQLTQIEIHAHGFRCVLYLM